MGLIAITVLILASTVLGAFYTTLLLLIPSVYSLYNKNYKSAKLFLLLPLVITLYIWKNQNTYQDNYIHNMAHEMNIECIYDMEKFYKEKGYTLRWISKEKNSIREYAMGEQKWALPFFSSTRYDLFEVRKCRHISKVKKNKVKKSLFHIADQANDILREEEPETMYFR